MGSFRDRRAGNYARPNGPGHRLGARGLQVGSTLTRLAQETKYRRVAGALQAGRMALLFAWTCANVGFPVPPEELQ